MPKEIFGFLKAMSKKGFLYSKHKLNDGLNYAWNHPYSIKAIDYASDRLKRATHNKFTHYLSNDLWVKINKNPVSANIISQVSSALIIGYLAGLWGKSELQKKFDKTEDTARSLNDKISREDTLIKEYIMKYDSVKDENSALKNDLTKTGQKINDLKMEIIKKDIKLTEYKTKLSSVMTAYDNSICLWKNKIPADFIKESTNDSTMPSVTK